MPDLTTVIADYGWIVTLVVLVPVVLVAGFVVVLFAVSMWETQHVREFVPLRPDELADVPPYGQAMAERAEANGFERVVVGRPPGRAFGGVLVEVLISPDRTTAAVIGSGRAIGTGVKKTALLSRFGGSQALDTRDEVGTGELSGLHDRRLLLNADFDELWDAHRAALAEFAQPPRPYSSDVVRDLETLEHERVQQMIRQGNAKPIDPAGRTWRYTLKGAFKVSVTQFFGQLAQARTQQDRARLPRPGS